MSGGDGDEEVAMVLTGSKIGTRARLVVVCQSALILSHQFASHVIHKLFACVPLRLGPFLIAGNPASKL